MIQSMRGQRSGLTIIDDKVRHHQGSGVGYRVSSLWRVYDVDILGNEHEEPQPIGSIYYVEFLTE